MTKKMVLSSSFETCPRSLLKDLDSYYRDVCHKLVNRKAQERLRQYHPAWSLATTHKNKIR